MTINTALSQIYGTPKTMLGANQKVSEKETYAKEVGNSVVLRFKTSSGTRYIVKRDGEEEERLAVINLEKGKYYIKITQQDTQQSFSNNYYICRLEKTKEGYKVTGEPRHVTSGAWCPESYSLPDGEKKDMSIMLNILLRAEKGPEYKKMLSAAIEAIK